MEKDNFIKCPKCGTEINVNKILYNQVEEQIKRDYEKKSEKKEKEIRAKLLELETKEKEVEKERVKLSELVEKQVQNKLKNEKIKLEKSIRMQIDEEKSEEMKMLETELKQKSEQVKELNKTKAEIERLKREKDELSERIAFEKEKEFSEKLIKEQEKIKQRADEENTLKIKELEKKLADQTKLAEEMKRKAEQGSQQMQGEIQELELENTLRNLHRFDEITEVKKGQRGADVLQIVRTNHGAECGKIYYESKRTKAFSYEWIQKLKEDNLEVKADVLVIVTEVMPPDCEYKYFLEDGVWICSFREIKGFSLVLRQGLLQVHSVAVTQQGKEGKMEQLYNYLTSQEFRGQFEAMLDGFKSLQDGYADEKLKMQKVWKEREKQLEKILCNAVNFYGSLKGIAGAFIPDIKMLEYKEELFVEE